MEIKNILTVLVYFFVLNLSCSLIGAAADKYHAEGKENAIAYIKIDTMLWHTVHNPRPTFFDMYIPKQNITALNLKLLILPILKKKGIVNEKSTEHDIKLSTYHEIDKIVNDDETFDYNNMPGGIIIKCSAKSLEKLNCIIL